MLVVFLASLHFTEVHFWMSSFNRVVDEGDMSLSGYAQQCSKYSYISHNGLFNSHAKYHCTKLIYMTVLNMWNIEELQRQKYIAWAEIGYLMPVLEMFTLSLN